MVMLFRDPGRAIDLAMPRGAEPSAYVIVIEDESSSIFHLPRTGSIVVGRDPANALRLNHASVSRRHATLRIDGDVLRIADLGSRNGTRVNGACVDRSHELASGDVVTVGDVTLLVRRPASAPPARVTYSEAGWRRRLAEEVERLVTSQRSLAAIAVIAPGLASAALSAALRLIDVVCETDDALHVLLPDTDREQARAIAKRILAISPQARLGLVMCPDDAADTETILVATRTAARRAGLGSIAEPAGSATRIDLGTRHVIVGDPVMRNVFALLERLAVSDKPIAIVGESGVGKQTAARAAHCWSKRTGPFVAVNCAELGADAVVGQLAKASGGTIFLAAADELPAAALQEVVRDRHGVRVIAAIDRGLDDEPTALDRSLRGSIVLVPPLRDRACEIPLLANAFLAEACATAHREVMTIGPSAMQVLLTERWPGNLRELRGVMERAALEPGELTASTIGHFGNPAAQRAKRTPSTQRCGDAAERAEPARPAHAPSLFSPTGSDEGHSN